MIRGELTSVDIDFAVSLFSSSFEGFCSGWLDDGEMESSDAGETQLLKQH